MRQPFGHEPALWEQFERTIAHYTLERGPRDPYVESLRFPPMIRLYRGLVRSGWIPPTPQQFADRVLRVIMASLGEGDLRPDPVAVRARAVRAYISLIVQHHACLVLQALFGPVIWDDDLDMRHGVDLIAIGNDAVAVGLALRAPTERSRSLAGRKAQRYGVLPFTVVALEVEPHDYVAGPFWLYRPEILVAAVVGEIRAHWDAKALRMEAAACEAYALGQRRPKASRQDFMDGVHAAILGLRSVLS